MSFKDVFVLMFDRAVFKKIFKEGIINLSCAALVNLVALLIRNQIIHQIGEKENGIYQIVISVTAYYTPFITNPLWAGYFPLLSARGINKETQHIIQNTLKYAIIASSAICLIVLTFPELLIRILSSAEFLKAVEYFPLQMLGDVWYFLFFIFGIYLLSQRKVKQYLVIWIVFLTIQYIIAEVLISRLGVKGAAIAYSASCIVVGVYAVYEFRKLISKRDFIKVLKILFVSVLFLATLAISCLYGVTPIIKLAVLICWGLLLLRLFNYFNLKKFILK